MIEFFKSAKFKGIVATILICILLPLYSYFGLRHGRDADHRCPDDQWSTGNS